MMKKNVSLCIVLITLFSVISVLSACSNASGNKDYSFTAGGVTLTVGQSASVIGQLGTPTATDESPYCGGVAGVTRRYTFSGYTVETQPTEKQEIISQISLTDDSVQTPEGVRIGGTHDDIIKKMGTPTQDSDSRVIFEGKNVKLTFILRDGSITNIVYSMM